MATVGSEPDVHLGRGQSLFWRLTLVSFGSLNNIIWISAYRFTDRNKFCDVESAFPEFEFRHECLTLPKALPKLYLCYARVLSSLHEQFDHSLV